MMNQRKITVFAPSLDAGGAEKAIVNLVNGFINENLKVDLILATGYKGLIKEVHKEINIIEFDHRRSIYSLFSFIKYLRKNRSSIILSHLRANRIAILANLLSGKKSKIYVVEHTTHSIAMKNLSRFVRIITKIIYKLLYSKVDMIIHVSQEAAADLENQYNWEKGSVKVAYNPIVNENILNQKSSDKVHEWFESNRSPVILGVGRLIADKNFSLLVDAFSLIRKEIDCYLIILGKGPQKIMLEEKISNFNLQDRVYLAGYVDNPFDYMKKASVFVLSSKREGLPSVLIEALACGCPVVSTNCPSGPAEILEFGKYGELVPVDNSKMMAEAIIKTIKNPPRSELLIERAKYFTIERSVRRYMDLLGISPVKIVKE